MTTLTEIKMLSRQARVFLSNGDSFLVPQRWMFLVKDGSIHVGMEAHERGCSPLNGAVYELRNERGHSVGAVNVFIGRRIVKPDNRKLRLIHGCLVVSL